MLARRGFRQQVLKRTRDPALRQWFDGYFADLESRQRLEIINPVYDWPVAAEFAHRAMTMTLVHEFNPLGHAPPAFQQIRRLHQLATILWQP